MTQGGGVIREPAARVGRAYLPDMGELNQVKAHFQRPNVGQVCPTYGSGRATAFFPKMTPPPP
jgi:hypothetical protein